MPSSPLHRLADRYAPRFANTFERSVKQLRQRVTDELVAEAMIGAEPTALFQLLDGLRFAKADQEDDVAAVFAELLSGGAGIALEGEEALRDALTVTSPHVREAAQTLTADLVTNVTAETKRAIRRLIADAVTDGTPPAEAARLMRKIVGLTERDALAVRRLAETQPAQVEKVANRLLRRRATMIARTETIRASNRGQQLAWEQMNREGLLDRTRFRQVWITTPDDRLCPQCAPMSGQTVSLGQEFASRERGVLSSQREAYDGAIVESPPLHPGCRCTIAANFTD